MTLAKSYSRHCHRMAVSEESQTETPENGGEKEKFRTNLRDDAPSVERDFLAMTMPQMPLPRAATDAARSDVVAALEGVGCALISDD